MMSLEQPHKLSHMKGRFSQGQDTMGSGFFLDAHEKGRIELEDPRSREVIKPVFNGDDISNLHDLTPYQPEQLESRQPPLDRDQVLVGQRPAKRLRLSRAGRPKDDETVKVGIGSK